MNSPENRNTPSLELSKESLDNLLVDLRNTVVQKGIVRDHPGTFPVENEQAPVRFEYLIDKQIAKELFYPDDECVLHSAEIAYASPYSTDPDNDFSKIDGSILLTVISLLPDQNKAMADWVERAETYWIYRDELDGIRGEFDTEYSTQAGHRISPNDVVPYLNFFDSETGAMWRTEDGDALLEDLSALQRPLTHEDEELLRKLIAYLEVQPTLT